PRTMHVRLGIALALAISGCATYRSADDLRDAFVDRTKPYAGRAKDDVLANVGVPTSTQICGDHELWGYFGEYGSAKSRRTRVVYLVFIDERLFGWAEGREYTFGKPSDEICTAEVSPYLPSRYL